MYDTFARFYDRLQSDVDYDRIADNMRLLLSSVGIKSGLVLDLGCGSGTLTRKLRDMGFDMIGADKSAAMLSSAIAGDNERIQYICQDMAALDLFGTIDACVSCLDCLNHLPSEAALRKTFDRVSLFMNAGGAFVFDLNTVKKHRETLGNNSFVIEKSGKESELFCVWRNETSPRKGGQLVTDIHLDFFEKQANGSYQRYEDMFRERAYPLAQIREMLITSGFEVIGCYDWLSGAALTENSAEKQDKAVFLAKKIPE
jgi:SAM-dependent methyltransferase